MKLPPKNPPKYPTLQPNGIGGAFDPVTLFAGGKNGGLYDVSDLSTLWQDTAGTSPVTTDGQSVARIDDLSGNGRNLIQATVAARPVYHTSAGLHWMEFDGVDDTLAESGTHTLQLPFFAATSYFKAASSLLGMFGSLQGGTNFAMAGDNSTNSQARGYLREGVIGQVVASSGTGQWVNGTAAVLSTASIVGTTDVQVDDNAIVTTANAWLVGTTIANCRLRIAGTSGGAAHAGRFYAGMALFSTVTTTQRNNVRDWLGERAGLFF